MNNTEVGLEYIDGLGKHIYLTFRDVKNLVKDNELSILKKALNSFISYGYPIKQTD